LVIGKIVLSIGLVCGIIGALPLAMSEYRTKKQIQAISKTRVEQNPDLEKSLSEKSLLAKIASPFLAIGFVLQLVGINLPD